MILGPIALAGATDDDDENTAWFRRTNRLFEDISTGLDPRDLVRPLTQPLTTLVKMGELLDGIYKFVSEGLVQGETDSRG